MHKFFNSIMDLLILAMLVNKTSNTFVARVCARHRSGIHHILHDASEMKLVSMSKKAKNHIVWKHTSFNKVHIYATIFRGNYMDSIALTLYCPDRILPSDKVGRDIYLKRFPQHIGFGHDTKPLFTCKVVIELDSETGLRKIVTAFPVRCLHSRRCENNTMS